MPSGLDLLKSAGCPDVESSKRSGVKSSHEDPSVATLDVTSSTMGMDSSSTTVRIVVLCRECVSTLPSSYLI